MAMTARRFSAASRASGADDRLEVGVAGADVGVDRVDDDQAAVGGAVHGGAELLEVVAQIGDRGDDEHAARVGAGGVESRADRVGQVVGGGEEDGGRGGGRCREPSGTWSVQLLCQVRSGRSASARRTYSVRPIATTGGAGGDVEGQQALAGAGVADEERDFAERNFFGPEPLQRLGGAVVGADELQFVGGFGAIGVVGVDEGVALHGHAPFWRLEETFGRGRCGVRRPAHNAATSEHSDRCHATRNGGQFRLANLAILTRLCARGPTRSHAKARRRKGMVEGALKSAASFFRGTALKKLRIGLVTKGVFVVEFRHGF